MSKIPAKTKRLINREIAALGEHFDDISVVGPKIKMILGKYGYQITEGHEPFLTGDTGQDTVPISVLGECEIVDNTSLSISWYKYEPTSHAKRWELIIHLT